MKESSQPKNEELESREKTKTKSEISKIQTNSVTIRNRASGCILLILLFGILWIYGFSSEIIPSSGSYNPSPYYRQQILGFMFIFSAVFTVIGFGLIFTYFKNATGSALFLSLFIVSLTILISPIFSKFWFNIFLADFQGDSPQPNLYSQYLLDLSLTGSIIQLDFYSLKIALANSISQLVLILSIFGRISHLQAVIISFLYNFFWNLNYFLLIEVQRNGPDTRIYDDFQINSVYLFASMVGIIITIFLKHPPSFDSDFGHNKKTAITAHLGTFFIFLSFCCTTTLFAEKSQTLTEVPRNYVWIEAFIGTFFALSASVLSTYSFSILFGGNIGIRESLLGTITGAIIYGSIAGTSMNISASISTGLLAGLISACYFRYLLPKINESHVFDSLGLYSIFLTAFIGTFFIAPIVLKTYYNYNVSMATLQNANFVSQKLSGASIAGWILSYVGISIGIGSLSGIVVVFLVKLFDRLANKEYHDVTFFNMDYGLRQKIPVRLVRPDSSQDLVRQEE